jgi:hypothetical protein
MQKFTALSIIAFTKVLGNLLIQIARMLLLNSLKTYKKAIKPWFWNLDTPDEKPSLTNISGNGNAETTKP